MPPLQDALNSLASFLVADASLGDTLQRVAEITTAAVPAAEYLGISMLNDAGRATTAIFTDEESPEIDSAQYADGVGPCMDAWRTGATVRIDDMRMATDTYPSFARAALEHGILSTLSLPLVVGGAGFGAMNLYAKVDHGFTAEDEATAGGLATAAASALANSQAYWQTFELAEGLQEAMKSRAVIEQAKGMLMARSPNLTADEAFDFLKKASQRENIKLRDVARRIVERRASGRPEE